METRSVRTQIYLGSSLHILGAAQPSGNFDDTWSRFGRSENDPSITSSWQRGFCALHDHHHDDHAFDDASKGLAWFAFTD